MTTQSVSHTPRVAVVQACWHKPIVDEFVRGFTEQLEALQAQYEITNFEVPGVVEIPLMTKKLTESGRFDAVVVTGLIVDHGVYRHEFVAASVMQHVMDVQMQSGIPVIYGILTAQEFLSEGRDEFFKGHFPCKGVEAANALVATFANLDAVMALAS